MSGDVWVMLHPKAAYSHLFAQPTGRGAWVVLRRPLFVALVLGCTVSLLTLRSLSVRLVLSSMIAWAFVPLFEIAALAAVWALSLARHHSPPAVVHAISLSAAIDLFFTGHAPWSLWLIGFGAFWSSVPHSEVFFAAFLMWMCSACAIVIWSCYIDLCFFRCISAKAGRALVLQRVVSWSLVAALWSGGWLPSEIVGRLGS